MKFEREWKLSTEHLASGYNIETFVCENTKYGPSDTIGSFRVADIVYEWAQFESANEKSRAAAGKFLRQWASGPQLKEPQRPHNNFRRGR